MPIEHREVVVDENELHLAVGAFVRVWPMSFPEGRYAAAKLASTPDGPVVEALFDSTEGTNQSNRFCLDSGMLIEVLVRFCHENNIPVPRAGRKSVQVSQSSVSLKIVLGETDTR
jgi:hypothetical protein